MLVLRLVKTYIDMLLGGHRKVPEFVFFFFWGGGGVVLITNVGEA